MSNELHDAHVAWEDAWIAEVDALDGTLPLPPLMRAALGRSVEVLLLEALDDDPDAQTVH